MCSCRMCHREAGRPRRLMPTVERLMGMWCGCCGFVRYQETWQLRFFKRPPPFCHPVKWPLAADLDLQPTPWSCMHCQSLPVLSLHWHAPLTFLEPLLPQDSPTAHSACSLPGASASLNVHPMRLACSLIPGTSALLCLITMHPLCISHTQPSLQPLLPPVLVASSRLLLVLLCSPPLPKPVLLPGGITSRHLTSI